MAFVYEVSEEERIAVTVIGGDADVCDGIDCHAELGEREPSRDLAFGVADRWNDSRE